MTTTEQTLNEAPVPEAQYCIVNRYPGDVIRRGPFTEREAELVRKEMEEWKGFNHMNLVIVPIS